MLKRYTTNVPRTLIDKCPPDQRIGQWIINNRHKTMSMMFNDEVEWRQRLWNVPNDLFWSEFADIVDVTK